MNLLSITSPKNRSFLWPLSFSCPSQFSLIGKTISKWRSLLAEHSLLGVQARVYEDVWLSLEDIRLLAEKDIVLTTQDGEFLAWSRDVLSPEKVLQKPKEKANGSFIIQYPWQFLAIHHQLLEKLPTLLPAEIHTESQNTHFFVGKNTEILSGVVVEGDIIVGENCKIGPHCYLRGPLVIGNDCRIGQGVEVKNSIVGNSSSIPHLSYVGDSIIGDNVNFGAGSIIANVLHQEKTISSPIYKNGGIEMINTGKRKLGAIIGDNTRLGIGTMILPGRKLAPNSQSLPQSLIREDLRDQKESFIE